MATLATGQLTLLDWAKRLDPDGKVPAIAEMLSQTNDILEDMVFMKGNLETGHRVVIRTGLPTVYFRLLNQGTPTSKSTTAQVDEGCGMMEARSYIDSKLLALNSDAAEFRMSEDRPFIEAMNQAMCDTIMYGNPGVDPKTFTGLATRYGAISGAGNAQNVMDAGGSGSDNTSIYLVVWAPETVFGIFPKNLKAGLQHRSLGEEAVRDASGNEYQADRTLFQWDAGLVVKDWRYVVRICNIDVSDLQNQTTTQTLTVATNVIKMMARALDRIPNLGLGRAAFYMNRTVMSYLRIIALDKSSNALSIEKAINQFGSAFRQMEFLGVPVRKVDRIINLETRVT